MIKNWNWWGDLEMTHDYKDGAIYEHMGKPYSRRKLEEENKYLREKLNVANELYRFLSIIAIGGTPYIKDIKKILKKYEDMQ